MTLETSAALIAGLVLLVAGAELLVRGASRLAALIGISPLVIGLTIVAYGTSAPELAVSSIAAVHGGADIAIGNVIGSNIFNLALILGISAVVTPLVIAQQLIRIDMPLMVGVSLLMWGMARDGHISRPEGALLVAGAAAYTVLAVLHSRRETAEVQDEYGAEYGAREKPSGRSVALNLTWIALGVAMLVIGSEWLIDGAVALARTMGVSELIISLTLVAAGTSLPELATSLVAAARGERDIAVGNVVGSNIFNILAVLGISAAVARNGVAVSQEVLSFDLPAMTLIAAMCLPVFLTGRRISRGEGVLFLAVYAVYLAVLVSRATHTSLLGVVPLP